MTVVRESRRRWADAYVSVEFQKQDGTTVRVNKNWDMFMRDILHYRGEDHVHYALGMPGDVVPGK